MSSELDEVATTRIFRVVRSENKSGVLGAMLFKMSHSKCFALTPKRWIETTHASAIQQMNVLQEVEKRKLL